MARETSRWDAADTLETKQDIAAYLDAVLKDGESGAPPSPSPTSLAVTGLIIR